MITVTFLGLASVLFIVGFIGLYLGFKIGQENSSGWKFCNEDLPPDFGRVIINYPVAFYHAEFGVVVDQAEYHPNRPGKWFLVPQGEPCKPYAWFDLAFPPFPLPRNM